jgi:hypothetical protein
VSGFVCMLPHVVLYGGDCVPSLWGGGGLILGDVSSTAFSGDRPLAYGASLWVYWATGELSISPIGGSRTRDDEREQ